MGVGNGARSKLTAASQSYSKGMAAVSEWGVAARKGVSAAWGRAWGGGILPKSWELPKLPLKKVTLGGAKVWGRQMQWWGRSGAGGFNSTAAGRPHWARRLASAFVR